MDADEPDQDWAAGAGVPTWLPWWAVRWRPRPAVSPGEWDLPGAVPSPAMAAAGSGKSWRVWAARVAVWGALAALPVFTVISLGMLSAWHTVAKPVTAGAGTVASSPGRDAATLAVTAWLAQTPAPLPGGRVLSWDGAVSNPASALTDADGKAISPPAGFTSETDTFTVQDGQGRLYTAKVGVAVDPRGGAVAAGGPSLEAAAPVAVDDWAAGAPWPGLVVTSDVPAPVATAIAGWASAYTSGDPAALRIAVGDTDGTHLYTPLSGVVSVASAPAKLANLSGTDRSRVVVQVGLAIRWQGQPAASPSPAAPGSQGERATTLDVLVERADTAAPLVTAWGGPGSGPSLTRYVNAVSAAGRDTTRPAGTPGGRDDPAGQPTPPAGR